MMSSYMKIGFNVVGRMAADCIIFLKNQDFYDEQLLKLLMIPGISPGRLERVARAKGSVEGGERQVGILLERAVDRQYKEPNKDFNDFITLERSSS